MPRHTGVYRITSAFGESVRAFIPFPLPPDHPPMRLDEHPDLADRHQRALAALDRLAVAGGMVPDPGWFLYGFVRKEAVLSSQIEGTEATLRDVATFEGTGQADRPDDVEEVTNYVRALEFARRQMADPAGLPLSTRLLCEAHRILMQGTRGEHSLPGEIRRSQNWIGGTRPGNARFVPPPPEEVPSALSHLERWIHQPEDTPDAPPPLVRAGLAHVQFETIHPFLDGNGRIGRMLITLLVEHWGLLGQPLLYLSLAFKRRQSEYYARLAAVRSVEGDEAQPAPASAGDWEGWTLFFLECVQEAADDAVEVAQRLFRLLTDDRRRLLETAGVGMPSVRLFELLPAHPVLTLARTTSLLGVTKPTAQRAIDALADSGILHESSGRPRDRRYVYQHYLETLTNGGA